jgi:hypothetical protein
LYTLKAHVAPLAKYRDSKKEAGLIFHQCLKPPNEELFVFHSLLNSNYFDSRSEAEIPSLRSPRYDTKNITASHGLST